VTGREYPGNYYVTVSDGVSNFTSLILDQTGTLGTRYPLQFDFTMRNAKNGTYNYNSVLRYHFVGPQVNRDVSFRVFPSLETNDVLSAATQYLFLHDWTNSRQYFVYPSNWQPTYQHGAYFVHYLVKNLNAEEEWRYSITDEDGDITENRIATYSLDNYRFRVKLNGQRSFSKVWNISQSFWPPYVNQTTTPLEKMEPLSTQYVGDLKSVELTLSTVHSYYNWYLKAAISDFWVSQTFCNDKRSTTCTSPSEGYTVVYRPRVSQFIFDLTSISTKTVTLQAQLVPLEQFTLPLDL
jgi:hypothetical protein